LFIGQQQKKFLAGAGYSCSLKQCHECHVISFPPSSETFLMIGNANKAIYVYWVEKQSLLTSQKAYCFSLKLYTQVLRRKLFPPSMTLHLCKTKHAREYNSNEI
jgi:hypothetical protein